MKRQLHKALLSAGLAAVLGFASAAVEVSPADAQVASYTQLLTNATASGNVVQPAAGSYFLTIKGTFSGATLTLTGTQIVGGASYTLGTWTSAPTSPTCIIVPQGMQLQMTVSGGSPSGLYATLGGVGNAGCPAVPVGGATSDNQASQITQETAINTVLGTKADAKNGATDTTAITLMQVQKEISAMAQAMNTLLGTQADTADCNVDHSLIACQRQTDADITGSIPAGSNNIGSMFPWAQPGSWVQGTLTSAMTGTTSTSLLAAPSGSLHNYLVTIMCDNSSASVSTGITIQDGSGGTQIGHIAAAAVQGGTALTFGIPLKQPTAATALYVVDDTTGASVKCTATGFTQ